MCKPKEEWSPFVCMYGIVRSFVCSEQEGNVACLWVTMMAVVDGWGMGWVLEETRYQVQLSWLWHCLVRSVRTLLPVYPPLVIPPSFVHDGWKESEKGEVVQHVRANA